MAIEGPLQDIGIHDVFQLLDLARKSGRLTVRSAARGNEGRVYFDSGAVVHATMRDNPHTLGALLRTLVRAVNPKASLDIGVFTGFSSLTVAMEAPDARVIALDVDAETTRTARRFWEEAGVADRIDLRIGPAVESLDALIAAGEAGTFDFAFIDADKPGYPTYVERVTELLRPGGVMLLDNMLWSVLEEPQDDAALLDRLSRQMAADQRLTVAVLPLGSGMTLATKNG